PPADMELVDGGEVLGPDLLQRPVHGLEAVQNSLFQGAVGVVPGNVPFDRPHRGVSSFPRLFRPERAARPALTAPGDLRPGDPARHPEPGRNGGARGSVRSLHGRTPMERTVWRGALSPMTARCRGRA